VKKVTHIVKKHWSYLTIAVGIIVLAVFISLLFGNTAMPPAPNEYHFGLMANFYSESETQSPDSLDGATAQFVALGQTPYLQIEKLHIQCPTAEISISRSLNTQEKNERLELGVIQTTVGNSRYSLPADINESKYPVVSIFCGASNSRLGYAVFQG